MNKFALATASILALGAGVAFAATDIAQLDTNKDGVLSYEELKAVAPSLTQVEFKQVDKDASNSWNIDELQSSDGQGYLARDNAAVTPDTGMVVDISKLDTNGDGVASMAEVQAMDPAITDVEFREMDTDRSGTLDVNEIQSDKTQGYLRRDEDVKGPMVIDMAKLDTNGDGVASMQEVTAMHPGITDVEFREMDTDKSGSLDPSELQGSAAQGYLRR